MLQRVLANGGIGVGMELHHVLGSCFLASVEEVASVDLLDCFAVVLPEVSLTDVNQASQCSLQGAWCLVNRKVGCHLVEDHRELLVDRREESSSIFPSSSTGLSAYNSFSYENTTLIELAAREHLISVTYIDDILRLKGDVCLINCCGGMSREIIVVMFKD